MPPPDSDSDSDSLNEVDFTDLFGFGKQSSIEDSGFVDIEFWDKLHGQSDGPNALGYIRDDLTLQGELKPPGENNGGLLYVSAFRKGMSVTLSGSLMPVPGSVPAYWLPWKKGATVYAHRHWFERSKCQYFLTTKLTGCQFVITGSMVLHIASDANGALDFDSGSGTRAYARTQIIGDVPYRKMSVTDYRVTGENQKHFGYGKYKDVKELKDVGDFEGVPKDKNLLRPHAFIFGMKQKSGRWIYKALTLSPGSKGVWETLVDPGQSLGSV